MKIFVITLLISCLFVTSALAYTCPAGSTPTNSIKVQTCDPKDQVNGSCPPLTSNGMNLVLDGCEDAPRWLSGTLQEAVNFKSEFYKLYEVDSKGVMIDGSITELNSLSWTYCSSISSNGKTTFVAFGTKGSFGVYISGSVDDSASTTSFKWGLTMDNYVFNTPGTSNDLVLFSKYENEFGDNSGTQEDSNNPIHQVVNSNSYIQTASSASYKSSSGTSTIAATSSSTDNGDTGYFVIFQLAGKNANFVSLTLDPRMGIKTSAAVSPLTSIIALVFLCLIAFFYFNE